jgi:hypothetical protein
VTEDVPATEAVAHEPAMEPATEAAQAAEAIEAAATPAVDETFVAPPAVAQTDDEALAIDGPWREGHREPIVETTEPAPVRADEAASEAVSIPEPIADIPAVEVAGEIAPLDENIEEPVAQGEPPAGIDAPAVTLVPEVVADQVAEEAPPTADVTDAVIAATPAGDPADAPEALSPLHDLGDLDDMPPLEAFAPEADATATEMEHAPTPSAEPVAEVEEALEEVTALDEDGENSGLDGGDESVHASADDLLSSPAGAPLNEGEPGIAAIAAEDDFFAGMDETLPVLELDSGGDLGPMTSGRDPDALLALDQIDMEGLEDIEVIEPTEPTLDSALGLDIDADENVAGPATDDASLTDSQFGRQVEAFASSANGEIVEDLPEIEAVEDPDEALANALSAPDEDADALADSQTTPEGLGAAGDNGAYAHTDTTAGGIEPLTMGMVADAAAVAGQQFEAAGDAVSLATPGVAEADAVVGAQAFVADANGQHVDDPASGDELDDQSFVAEGDAHAPAVETIEPETPATQPIGAERQDNGQHADDPGARPPAAVAVPAPRAPQGGGGGGGGGGSQGFVIGTDLSSFIGGMPLVLPNLPPPPQSAFGRVQVSFAGAKAPWEQAKRPSFPMGQSLAEEVTDAARGLRDVEALDAELESHGISRLSVPKTEEENELDGLGEGAPGDEWNVAAALEDDDDEQALAEWPGPAGTDAATADVATGDPATGNITVGEAQELTAHAATETLAQLPAQDQLESSSATEELAGEPVESEEPLEELELDSQPESEEPLAELELDSEAIDEDELLKELEVEDVSPVEPLSLER